MRASTKYSVQSTKWGSSPSLCTLYTVLCTAKLKFLLIICTAGLLLVGCEPTYKRVGMTESIRELAKREYNHDVLVIEIGDTIGVQLTINNMLAELVAEDQQLWGHMEELLMVLFLNEKYINTLKRPWKIGSPVIPKIDNELPRM